MCDKLIKVLLPLFVLLCAASCGQRVEYPNAVDDTTYRYAPTTSAETIAPDDYNPTYNEHEPYNEYDPYEPAAAHPHANLFQLIADDAELLAHIEAVTGAALHLDYCPFHGYPFITVLPRYEVIIRSQASWAQELTVFLRPDYNHFGTRWMLEAYELSGNGIVLAEPLISMGAAQPMDGAFTMRVYYRGIGGNGDWYDFDFALREVPGDNWTQEAIRHIREVTGISVRDMWFNGGTLHILMNPLEDLLPWGQIYYRRTKLYLTGASLPGVARVHITTVPAGRFAWEEPDFYSQFVYIGREVLRGHHWAWAGPGRGEQVDEVLAFFEQELHSDLAALAEYIAYTSDGNAQLHYTFTWETSLWFFDNRAFYRVMLDEKWFDAVGDAIETIPHGAFYICEDFTEIFWRFADGFGDYFTLAGWRMAMRYLRTDTVVDFDDIEWVQKEFITIPSFFLYQEVGLHNGRLITWGDIRLYAGVVKGSPYWYDDRDELIEPFVFSDGHEGLFIPYFGFNTISWVRRYYTLINLTNFGDISVFTEHEEMILQIVRSLRMN